MLVEITSFSGDFSGFLKFGRVGLSTIRKRLLLVLFGSAKESKKGKQVLNVNHYRIFFFFFFTIPSKMGDNSAYLANYYCPHEHYC